VTIMSLRREEESRETLPYVTGDNYVIATRGGISGDPSLRQAICHSDERRNLQRPLIFDDLDS